MATIMFAAPVQDLRTALINGSLGPLNCFPWAIMTGNCLGWTVYGYYTKDPFIVAANLPGLLLSIWLNTGAAKLQYLEVSETVKRQEQARAIRGHWDASSPIEAQESTVASLQEERKVEDTNQTLLFVPQEQALLRVLCVWSIVLVWVGWFSTQNAASTVGIVVNVNLVFFYGAPLQTMRAVITESNSESIHIPTMIMNWCNTSFWIAYGFARRDPVIILPNSIGLLLGIMQGILCALYPRRNEGVVDDLQPLHQSEEEEEATTQEYETSS